MPTVTNYPNGQTLTSSALTLSQINLLIQNLTCGMLGVNPPDFSQVKIDWPVEGQPFTQTPAQDCCYLACTTSDAEYSRVRDRAKSQASSSLVTETYEYTRNWRVAWTLYGPNSVDRARQLHSATFMDWVNDALSLSNLYPVSDPPEPTRTPESFNAQWWERTDFRIDMYEQVTETINVGVVTSVEVKVYAGLPGDPVADVTVTQ